MGLNDPKLRPFIKRISLLLKNCKTKVSQAEINQALLDNVNKESWAVISKDETIQELRIILKWQGTDLQLERLMNTLNEKSIALFKNGKIIWFETHAFLISLCKKLSEMNMARFVGPYSICSIARHYFLNSEGKPYNDRSLREIITRMNTGEGKICMDDEKRINEMII